MATDVERLVTQMSADFKSYENAFAKASGITRAQLKLIKTDAAAAGGASSVAFDGAARGVARLGQSASSAQRNVRVLRADTMNLGAQFQDIAVQLGSGTSPFQVALQQGTQISAVLGSNGAAGAVKTLGAAFLSVVNPVSLVTIGLIAAGGAAIQYFAGMLGEGEKSAEELKKQALLIQQVAKEWGDAVPAVAAYAAEVERAASVEDLQTAVGAVTGKIASEAREEFEAFTETFRDLLPLLPEVNTQFASLSGKVESGSATAADYAAAQTALNAEVDAGGPRVAALKAAFDSLVGSLNAAGDAAAKVQSDLASATSAIRIFRAAEAESNRRGAAQTAAGADIVAEHERVNVLTGEQLAIETEIASVRAQAAAADAVIAPAVVDRIARENLAAEKRRAEEAKAARAAASAGKSGRSKAASEAERERKAVTDLIEQLTFEQSLIGVTAVEKEKANALRRAGAAATADQRAQIEQLVDATYAEVEALKQNEERLQGLKSLSNDVLGGMFEDLRDGASGADLLANALNRVAEQLIQIGLNQVTDSLFGANGPFANSLSGIFGRMAPGPSVPVGVHHAGGVAGGYVPTRSVPAGLFVGAPRMHSGGIAGLRPSEVPAILQRGERVLPRGAGGGDVTVQVINAPQGTRVEESKGPDGSRMIRVMLTEEVRGMISDRSLDKTLGMAFGLRRRGT